MTSCSSYQSDLTKASRSASPTVCAAAISRAHCRRAAERAGHSRASMSLDVYSHTLPPGEVALEKLLARLAR